jgi:RNA polymerase sigma factor (sigma-70 family)
MPRSRRTDLRIGDTPEFSYVHATLYKTVYRIVASVLSIKDDAEDVVQEVFLSLYGYVLEKGWGEFIRPEDESMERPILNEDSRAFIRVRCWLRKTAVRKAVDARRNHQARTEASERVAELEFSPPVETPEELRTAGEDVERLRHALGRIPERDAQMLILKYTGHSHGEIAEAFRLSTGSVGTLLVRAEKRLFARFADACKKDEVHRDGQERREPKGRASAQVRSRDTWIGAE